MTSDLRRRARKLGPEELRQGLAALLYGDEVARRVFGRRSG